MTERPKRPKTTHQSAPGLWRLAEQLVVVQDAMSGAQTAQPAPEQAGAVWHEMRVNRIEQEMQNEELRNAQFELEASRDRYFDLYDLAPVGYCTVSATGLILQVNLATATLLGRAREALMRQPITRFICADDQDAFYLLSKRCLAGDLAPCELRLAKADGARVWVQVTASAALEANGAANLRLVLSDISTIKLAEARRREVEERYEALVKASPDAILIMAPDGRTLAANPAACRMFGRSEEELKRIGRAGVFDSADPRLALALEQRRLTGQFIGELAFLRRNGERFTGEVSVSNFDNAGGQRQWSIIIRDATERLRAQAALRDNARQLQALSVRVLAAQEAERHRVARELHDELGQALTAIKINLQVRGQSETPQSLNTENLRIVEDALQQVRHLAQELRPSMLDDLGLVPALRWLGKQMAARSGFALQFHSAGGLERFASGTETACFRIVQEALTNIARHAKAKHVHIDLRHDGHDAMLLCVRDDGVGFDPAVQQAHAMAGESMGVIGMQERATLIGGKLVIESQPGHGCEVRLHFPVRWRAPAQSPADIA